jgi:transcriptional regulator with XRE-family HTH domain
MDHKQAKTLGEILRRRRHSLGLSIRQLGERAQVTNTTITRIEQGAFKAPRPDKLARITAALGLGLGEIFARAGYLVPEDLPDYVTYVRTTYPELPETAIKGLFSHFQSVLGQHGLTLTPALVPLTEEVPDDADGDIR